MGVPVNETAKHNNLGKCEATSGTLNACGLYNSIHYVLDVIVVVASCIVAYCSVCSLLYWSMRHL